MAAFVALACVWALLALGLNLQWGYGGMFNAGIAGFWAVGAYTAAIVTTPPSPPNEFGYPGHLGGFAPLFPAIGGFSTSILAGMVLATLAAGVAGLLIAIPTLRLRADYLAIATLGLAQITTISINNLQSVTGGVFGIPQIPRPFEFQRATHLTELSFMAFVGLILLGVLLLVDRMSRSPWGRLMRAVREDEDAAMAIGKNTFALKLQTFVIGASLMGLAGALFAYFQRVITVQNQFTPADTFTVWTMVVVGGSGNHKGVVAGAFLFYFLFWFSTRAKDWFGLADFLAERIFYLRLIAIGVLLIALVVLRPAGLLPEPRTVSRRPRFLLGRDAG